LDNLFQEIAKLECIRALQLPPTLFDDLAPTVLQAYRQRVAVEEPYELRRHAVPLRMTLLAAYCLLRGRELTDILVDLLLELVHRLGAKAERKVGKALVDDLKRVHGKTGMLYRVAEASLDHPTGVVHEVIFPVVSEATLRDLVKEWKATGPFYRAHVQTVMRSAYRSHYRRMLPPLLATLEFRSNNGTHQPLIRALALLKQYLPNRVRTYPVEEDVPLEGVIRDHWREAVVEIDAQGRQRVNRLTYEMCVLQALRDQLRCKEIWVVGANRYQNPDEDVPQDFTVQRPTYYAALKLPARAEDFIQQVQQEMRDELAALDRSLPRNGDVEILPKAKGWIKLSPLAPEYDNMVKYSTALRLGTADTDAILRRFTRHNVQRPTYTALLDLGKARRTIFLCRYLRLRELRREIHEGLNVVENWNSANDFILFGKGGEIAANRREDQELSMLTLHLLQNALVYINTLMLQRVLSEAAWATRLTVEDLRALTPLIYAHVSPYGHFLLDMLTRLDIELPLDTDTGAPRHTALQRDDHPRMYAGVAARKRSSSPYSSCTFIGQTSWRLVTQVLGVGQKGEQVDNPMDCSCYARIMYATLRPDLARSGRPTSWFQEAKMQLTPRELEKLLVHMMADVALKRKAKGLKLNHPEAVAIISAVALEGARAGKTLEEVTTDARSALTKADVMDGVADLIPMVQIEAVFTDGSRLVTVHTPIQ
jgi:urease gamma subunit